MPDQQTRVIVIGAGIGGLAAAARLSHAGHEVTVLESQPAPGGKMRTLPSGAGPVDSGPTVLTFLPVFEALFADIGERLADHLDLTRLPVIARHFWSDGTRLDLMSDPKASSANIETVFGSKAAREFAAFSDRAERLLTAFEGPMLNAGEPTNAAMVGHVIRRPGLALDMAPLRSLAGLLTGAFSDPKLAQLFARYATYVGGLPQRVPALLSLIAAGEARGVWAIRGGMHRLAQCLADLAQQRGAEFHYGSPVQRIVVQGGRPAGVETEDARHMADIVVFNGDPRALQTGLLGPGVARAVPSDAVEPRSLSAHVMAFGATPTGPELSYHNVFFGDDPKAEFAALDRDAGPDDATLYLCAQDRAEGIPKRAERFEVIRNAPPLPAKDREKDQCQRLILDRFAEFGLRFETRPGEEALTRPTEFDGLFPGSQGSLYGRSPHGLTAGLKRPTARTAIPGLYLVGGGAHPGAGVPMATLSARHVAEAIATDLASTSRSRPMATPGGISTGSARTEPVRSA